MMRVSNTMAATPMSATHAPATLLGALAGGADLSVARRTAAVLFMTALTAAAAQVSVPVPFTPVPFTLQPTLVILGGAALGARLGFTSQVLYLLLGAAGLPVFAASPLLPQGAARLLGPTAGFLLAYPLAAWVAGFLAERRFDRQYRTSVLAMLAGMLMLFAGGMLRLAYGPPAPLGLSRAFELGVLPFLPLDLVKLVIAAAVLPAVWRFVSVPPSTGSGSSPEPGV